MSQTLYEHNTDAIDLARLRQRVHALEIENRGLRHEVARLTFSRATTALIKKTKAKR
jgi:hypothetical protein